MRDGVTMTVVLAANNDTPSSILVAQQVASQLRNVGVDIKLALVNRDTLLKDYLAPRAFHIVLATWDAQGADPDFYSYWHSSEARPGGLNFSSWRNPVADSALEASRQDSDKAQRAGQYAEFGRAFYQDVPAIVLYNPLYSYATRDPAAGIDLPNVELLSPAYRFDTIGRWYLQQAR